MEIDKYSLGQAIKAIRIEENLNMEEFADLIKDRTNNKSKPGKSNVSRWERGENVPNDITLDAIAKIGEKTVNELLYGDKLLTDDLGNVMPDNLSLYDFELITTLSSKKIAKNGAKFYYCLLRLNHLNDTIYTGLRLLEMIDDVSEVTYLIENITNIDNFHHIFESSKEYERELSTQGITKLESNNFVDSRFYINQRSAFYSQNRKSKNAFLNELATVCIESLKNDDITINETVYYGSVNNSKSIKLTN